MNTKSIATTLLAISAVAIATAQSQTFTVGKGSPAQQIAQVESVTEFETFTGRTDKVTGTFKFDPKTKKGSGSISIAVKSIDTGIPLRNDHMNDAGWLDSAKYPTIMFETTKVEFVKGDTYKITGKFTMHGVTKTLTTNATVKYLAESAKTKAAGFKGNVLQVKSNFKVNLSDFGIKIPAPAQSKVANTVSISVTAFGQTGA